MHTQTNSEVTIRFKDTVSRKVDRVKRQSELQHLNLGPEFRFASNSLSTEIGWLLSGLRARSNFGSRASIVQGLLHPLLTDRNVDDTLRAQNHLVLSLFGYWITPSYFDLHSSALAAQIKPKTELPERLKRIAEEARSPDAIAIHVRRGDYFSKPLSGSYGFLTADYYVKGARLIAEILSSTQPKIFLFTDDAAWAERTLRPLFGFRDNVKVVSEAPDENASQHLWAMSQFQNLVLSNSTFSWWTAHLGPSKSAVVSPENWGPKLGGTQLIRSNWLKT